MWSSLFQSVVGAVGSVAGEPSIHVGGGLAAPLHPCAWTMLWELQGFKKLWLCEWQYWLSQPSAHMFLCHSSHVCGDSWKLILLCDWGRQEACGQLSSPSVAKQNLGKLNTLWDHEPALCPGCSSCFSRSLYASGDGSRMRCEVMQLHPYLLPQLSLK